jgi:hypothetical protein
MRKVFSILIALLILLSGVQLTISRHYCGGKLAESNVSIVGHLASCGMEGEADQCQQPGSHIKSHCCNNLVSIYAVDPDFTSSFFKVKTVENTVLQLFILTEDQNFYTFTTYNCFYTDVSPQANSLVSDVDLADICVFRI